MQLFWTALFSENTETRIGLEISIICKTFLCFIWEKKEDTASSVDLPQNYMLLHCNIFLKMSFTVWQMWLIDLTGWILYGKKLCVGIDYTNNLHCECDLQYILLISWKAFLHLLGDERPHKSRQPEKGYVKPFADESSPGRWQEGMGGERIETKTFQVWRKELSLCWKETVCQNTSGIRMNDKIHWHWESYRSRN